MCGRKTIIKKELLDAILPLFVTSKIVGLCPFVYTEQKNYYILTWSKKIYFTNLIIATTLVFWGFWGFINDVQIASFASLGFTGSVDIAISTSDISDVLLTQFYFVASSSQKLQKTLSVLKNFDEIDAIIKPNREIKTKSFVLLGFWSTFMPLLITLDAFMWGNTTLQGLNNYLAYYICYCVVIMHELQYWHLVEMAHVRLGSLNEKIREIIIYKSVRMQYVLKIIKCYDLIVDAIENINDGFNVSTALMILSCYVHLITSPYQLFVMVTSNETSILNYVYLLWVCLQFFRLLLVVEVCHKCEREIDFLKNSIALLMCCKMERDVKTQASDFFFVVRKRKIYLVAYGLPKIRRSLILQIAGSISSYWMILLQLQ